MALAGCDRIFALLDETPETDDGYVTLVNAKKMKNGILTETSEHTGRLGMENIYIRQMVLSITKSLPEMWYLMMWISDMSLKKSFCMM